jgi:hypothetical protein
MSGTAYRLLGLFVWRALKWYVREHLPSPRRVLLSATVIFAVLGAAAALLRRATG